MPEGQYGPGGKWIHDRAHRIMESMGNEEEYSPEKRKAIAYATATQQAHKVGKSPKSFRTSQGVREAKVKHDKPKSEYQKTAASDILMLGERSMIDMATVSGFMDEFIKIADAGSQTFAPGMLEPPRTPKSTAPNPAKHTGPLYDPKSNPSVQQGMKTPTGSPGPKAPAAAPKTAPQSYFNRPRKGPGVGASIAKGWKGMSTGGKAALIGVPAAVLTAGAIGGALGHRRSGQTVNVAR